MESEESVSRFPQTLEIAKERYPLAPLHYGDGKWTQECQFVEQFVLLGESAETIQIDVSE